MRTRKNSIILFPARFYDRWALENIQQERMNAFLALSLFNRKQQLWRYNQVIEINCALHFGEHWLFLRSYAYWKFYGLSSDCASAMNVVRSTVGKNMGLKIELTEMSANFTHNEMKLSNITLCSFSKICKHLNIIHFTVQASQFKKERMENGHPKGRTNRSARTACNILLEFGSYAPVSRNKT